MKERVASVGIRIPPQKKGSIVHIGRAGRVVHIDPLAGQTERRIERLENVILPDQKTDQAEDTGGRAGTI